MHRNVFNKVVFKGMSWSVLALGIFACAPVYVPNARNTPLFESKGEFQATASAGMGYNLQTAYAITDHLGITGNLFLANNERAEKFQHRTQEFGELGLGYFGKRNKLYFEIYGGFGIGKGSAADSLYYVFHDDIVYTADGRYQKIFVQPAIGTKHPNFEWSLSSRLARLNYTNLKVNHGAEPMLVQKYDYLFLEPSVNLKIALKEQKTVFLVMQGGLNIPLYNESSNAFDVEQFSGGVGLQFRILPKP